MLIFAQPRYLVQISVDFIKSFGFAFSEQYGGLGKGRRLVRNNIIHLFSVFVKQICGIRHFLGARHFILPPESLFRSYVSVGAFSPAEGKNALSLYIIYLSSHQMEQIFAYTVYLTALPIGKTAFGYKFKVIVSTVDKGNGIFTASEIFYDLVFTVISVPQEAEIPADYDGIAFFQLSPFLIEKAVDISVHIPRYVYHRFSPPERKNNFYFAVKYSIITFRYILYYTFGDFAMKKAVFCLILIFCLIFSVTAGAYEVTGFDVNAKNALLVSLDTDEILYQKDIDERIFPASITKIMTALVILENVGDLDSYRVTMSQNAYDRILGTGSSVLEAKVGETFSGKDALAAILISSAGDIVYAFAESVAGDVEAFTELMNQKAAALGLTGTHYQNPIGLHDQNNYTTVRDIWTLEKYMYKNYPLYLELTSKSRYRMSATNMSGERILCTTNMMIDPNTVYYYAYCTGGKTGFTDEAGRCLCSTAKYNGYTYMCVTMNCPTVSGTRNEFVTSKNLYRWAFNNFEFKSVLDTSTPVCELPVEQCWSADYVSLYPANQVTSILPKEADESTIVLEPRLISPSVIAPVKKGDVLGEADVIYANEVIGKVNLVAGNDLDRNAVLAVLAFFKTVFTSSAFLTVLGVLLLFAALFIAYCVILNRKKKRKRKVKYIPYGEKELAEMKKKKDDVSPPNPDSDDYFNI